MTGRRRIDCHPLAGLRNVGPAALADFERLGISSLAQLAASDADTLYLELQRRTRQSHDPCVWDVFAAAIHQARTGEPLDWWHFTPARKVRQFRGEFPQLSAAHSRPPSAPAGSSLREMQPVTASSEARDG